MDKASEAIVITDDSTRILYVNESFSVVTGYSATEAVGRPTSLLKSGLHDRPFDAAMWDSLLSQGHWRGEIWNRKKSGEIHDVPDGPSPVGGDAGDRPAGGPPSPDVA